MYWRIGEYLAILELIYCRSSYNPNDGRLVAAKKDRKKRGTTFSHLANGCPLFSTRVYNLASSQQRSWKETENALFMPLCFYGCRRHTSRAIYRSASVSFSLSPLVSELASFLVSYVPPIPSIDPQIPR